MKKIASALLIALLAMSQAKAPRPQVFQRPLVLVHGWGPPAIIGFNRYVRFLRDDGVPAARIHVLRYNSLLSLASIRSQLASQLREVAARYPAGQRFDVITHSTGQFVALDALLATGLDARVEKYVGLSGIAHGWDCPACERGWLGKAEKELAPAYNRLIENFYARHADRVAALEKCSLFSPDDGLIAPYDSGRFDDGHNVEVDGMRHMESVKDRRYYELMKAECYAADAGT